MKANVSMVRGKMAARASSTLQSNFELKQRVVLALNKLADRDTYQIGVKELDNTVEQLTPDEVAPFLSCILDTDSDQKSAVRKECIRLMGTMATSHGALVCSHLHRMVSSIVKRLKDSDSVVRDACVETVGVLACKLSAVRMDADFVFRSLVKPLFEALGEQNKYVQFGSALCLSRVVDSIHDPPPLVLQKMLARTAKLLKNPHFMAKPAVVELNRSIIMAGGTTTHSSLKAALSSIQESLKNSDWATRKAACTALADIASCGMACLGSYRSSCISCLETCRFDKVKPVRDIALHALQLWKNLPVSDTLLEPSETGSSIRDDYGEVTSISNSTPRNNLVSKYGGQLTKRVPLSSNKPKTIFLEKPQLSESSEWTIEFAVPKHHKNSEVDRSDEEYDCSSASKRCAIKTSKTSNIKNIGFGYVKVEEKQECSSVSEMIKEHSDIFTESIKSEVVLTTPFGTFDDDASFLKSTGTSRRFATDEVSIEEQRYLTSMQHNGSLDSTVTDTTPHPIHGCCMQTAKDMILIRKQLVEIENKQSNLMELLKAFTTSMMDSVSTVQSKVSNLEQVVNKMAHKLANLGETYSDVSTKPMKYSPNVVSSRLSSCSSRPSVESSNKQPPTLQPSKHSVAFQNSSARSRPSAMKQNLDMWADTTPKLKKSPLSKENHEDRIRNNGLSGLTPPSKSRLNRLQSTVNKSSNHQSNSMKDYLYNGDLDSAYGEALNSRNELILFELLDKTGPSLEYLSPKIASELLSTLATFLLEQRFVDSIMPWLSYVHGPNYVSIPAKAKRDFLRAIQETAKLDLLSLSERRYVFELGNMLHQIWA